MKKVHLFSQVYLFLICRNIFYNLSKSSYDNSEAQNFTFYIDTLLFIVKGWKEELSYKLLPRKLLSKVNK